MNFDEMPWLVTVTSITPSITYGPLSMPNAISLSEQLRSHGQQAQAWAAQAPDERAIVDPRLVVV